MSVRDVTDSNGSLLARYDFSPWGERMLMQGTDVVSFGFTGQSSSRPDIWNMTYRDYDATIARWLNQDPIGLAGGINLHGYVQGNPIRNIDPSGLVTVMSSGPQRTGVTSSEIDGGCGLYDPNATFSGACKCMAGGFKAELLVTFHPKIFVALDVVTPPEDIYNHELMHHQVAQGTVNAAIREGEAIERRVFGSQGECNSAITKWAQSYEALMMKRTVRERLADFFGLFWCNPMRRDVSA